MWSIKQGVWSIKEKKEHEIITLSNGKKLTLPLRKHNDIYVQVHEARETMYTDKTGTFHVQSRKGNKYIMILREIDNNIILNKAMHNRTADGMVRAYQILMKRLKAAGIHPKKHVLDNEASAQFKQEIKEHGLDYELVPKGQHRRNIAEKAIQTWKAHTIGVHSGLSAKCPLSLWDKFLPQIDMQVNLLRFSNVAPNVCAWTVLHGAYNFNHHPLAPLGIEMQMLEHPDKRKTWGVKNKPVIYLGTSLEHYRYFWGYNFDTKAIRGSETVIFKHKYITNPSITPGDAIVNAAKALTSALHGNIPPPLVQSGIDQIRKLTKIVDSTKAEYEKRENEKAENSKVSSPCAAPPRLPNATHPRVAQPAADQPPDLIAVYDSNSDDKEDTEDCPGLIVACPRAVVALEAPKQTCHPIPSPSYITQNDHDDAPAQNTHSQSSIHSIMEEVMLSCVQFTPKTLKIDLRRAACGQYLLQLWCEMAGAVLDQETGDLLEYCHVVKHPVHQNTWQPAFGKKVGRLAQGLPGVFNRTDTIDFVHKSDIPRERIKDSTYTCIVCALRPDKKDPF